MSHRNTIDSIHSRQDEKSRPSLSEAERALLRTQPAGLTEITDVQLDHVHGGGFWLTSLFVVLGINAIKGAEEIGEDWACMVNDDKFGPEQCS